MVATTVNYFTANFSWPMFFSDTHSRFYANPYPNKIVLVPRCPRVYQASWINIVLLFIRRGNRRCDLQ